MKEFNINDYVKIKLTEAGIAILKNRHDSILKDFAGNPEALKTLGEFKNPEVDENGYTEMQMWAVMQVFGKYMYNGNPKLPFETTIAISEEYLKEQNKGRSL